MLSKDDNDLLNHVEPGWPLHDMFKRYWLPFLRSAALVADGPPRKVELLGESYVAFRGSDGKVGLLDEQCAHRGVSLTLARNENAALTCIFHGWTFDAAGQCLAMPTEADERARQNVNVRAFPVVEAGGACWVYLGPDAPPKFPDYQFTKVPPHFRRARVGYTESNWSQNVDTALDSSHVGVLHRNLLASGVRLSLAAARGVDAPRISIETTPYGFQSYARRDRADGTTYLRVTEYVAPFTILNGSSTEEESKVLMYVPINNRRTAFWWFYWDMHHTVDWWRDHHERLGVKERFWGNDDDVLGPVMDRASPRFGQDRNAMKVDSWSGFRGLQEEDAVVSESVPVVDRTKENLRASDVAIVRARRIVIEGARAFLSSGIPPGMGADGKAGDVPYDQLRGTSEVVAGDSDMVALHNQVLRAARQAEFRKFGERLARLSEVPSAN